MGSVKGKIIASFAALLIFIMFSYFFLDIPVALWCKSLDGSISRFFGILTELGISTWYLVGAFVLFLFFKFIRPHPLFAYRSLFVLAAVAVSGIIVNIIKLIFGRYRPEMFFQKGLYGLNFFNFGDGLASFPSGHATTAFALALALSFFFPKYRIPLFCLALAVGVSRVIITAHYLSDVVGGAYVGLMSVFFLREAFPSAARKISGNFRC